MSDPNLPRFLIQRERGMLQDQNELVASTQEFWRRPLALQPTKIELETTDQITQLRGREDFVVCLASHGQVFLQLLTKPHPRFYLSKECEITLKFFLVSRFAVLILKRRAETFLRFYAVDLDKARAGEELRTRLLPTSTYVVSALAQVDSSRGRIVITQDGEFAVWDLLGEKLLYSTNSRENTSVWYSQNYLVFGGKDGDCLSLQLENITTRQETCLSVIGMDQVDWLFKAGNYLCLYDQCSGLAVLDLESMTAVDFGDTPVSAVAELDSQTNAVLTCQDGTMRLLCNSQLQWTADNCSVLFTDSEDIIVVFDGTTLTVINGETVRQLSPQLPSEVTAIGINEDTHEIVLTCQDGNLLVFQ